jgi:hypothetical protein
MALTPFVDNIETSAPKVLDNKNGRFSGGIWRPYNTVAEYEAAYPILASRAWTQLICVLNPDDNTKADIYMLDKNKIPQLVITSTSIASLTQRVVNLEEAQTATSQAITGINQSISTIEGDLSDLSTGLVNEIDRSTSADQANADAIATETARAIAAENTKANTVDIQSDIRITFSDLSSNTYTNILFANKDATIEYYDENGLQKKDIQFNSSGVVTIPIVAGPNFVGWINGVNGLLSNYIPKNYLLDTPAELITNKISGYWGSGATTESAITASATLSHSNLIAGVPGDKFVVQGITSATISNTIGAFFICFDESGTKTIHQGSGVLVADGPAYILTIPANIGTVRFGINFSNTDSATVSVKKGSSLAAVSSEKIKTNFLPTIPAKTSELTNDSGFITDSSISILKSKIQILDNLAGSPDFGIELTLAGVNLTFSWTGQILLSYNYDPSTAPNRYSDLLGVAVGTKTITLDATNQTTCYIKKSDFTGVTKEVIPVYYCRWGDDVLKDPNTYILITKNKSTKLKDCTGPLADFFRDQLNEKRILALEASDPGDVSFLSSDNESQNLFLRGNSPKTYVTTKKYGVIVAGQSNTEGRVPVAEAPIWLNQADPILPSVNMWNRTTKTFQTYKVGQNHTGATAATTLWSYDMVVAHLLQEYKADQIYMIKRARGGTAISQYGTNGGGYWDAYKERVPDGEIALTDSFEEQIRLAVAADTSFLIKAFLWHQGEGDYQDPAATDYYQNFKNVVAYVRGAVGNARLPVIFGSISTISAQFSQTVKDAQIKIANEDPYCWLVDMGAAPLLDLYHFNAASSESLGTQMFDIIKDF